MKKIILTSSVSVLMLLSFSLHAQQSSLLHANFISNIDKTIIRQMAHPQSVSYVETQSDHFFVLFINNYSPLITVSIDTTYPVNDFVILGDFVFFCGSNIAGQGFFGHFNIQDFFYGSHSYSVTTTAFVSPSSVVSSFDKMVADTLNGNWKLYAIGQVLPGQYVVADVLYHMSPAYVSYTIGELDINYNERLFDIILTDNYVVTTGFKSESTWGISVCVRNYRKSSVFLPGGPQDRATIFNQASNPSIKFDAAQIVASHTQADSFATALYWRKNGSNNDTGTMLNLFHIAPNSDVSCIGTIYTTQHFQNGKWRLRDMTPMENSSHFYLLQTAEYASVSSYVDMIFELEPSFFSTPPTVSSILMKLGYDPILLSIDAHKNYTGFVTNGFINTSPARMMFNYGTTNSHQCLFEATMPINNMNTVGKDFVNPFNLSSSTVGSIIKTGQVQMIGTNILCFE